MKTNLRIRTALDKKGLYLYQLGDILGVAESTVLRWMRKELPEAEQDRIVALIESGGVSHERKQ